ncbi:MAG: sulfatase [Thermostichales cyanobacterium SZTDM-1c_bins_54]
MPTPNILWIVLDTQRADALTPYRSGDPEPVTPHIAAWAERGTVYERGIATAQWTIPSHASMFTGEYPSTHQLIQADQALDPAYPTLAEILAGRGYQTVGFCNNPLVGILNNGLRRGFQTFYNYGGLIPSRPAAGSRWPWAGWWEAYTQFWRRLSYPVQNAFARSDFLFQLSLQPWFATVWAGLLNFKGNTAQCLADVSRFLRRQEGGERPFFCFVNLMETHLPYRPPQPFIDRFAPYFRRDRSARDFLRRYNREPYRWMAPLPAPLSPQQSQLLQDIYLAETSYQDHLLGQVFATLEETGLTDNTLVILCADHGEGLGEHDFVGHAFVVYEELIRVPLILRSPGQSRPSRVTTPVSLRRLFHTCLDLAGIPQPLSLLNDGDPEAGVVLSEAFPPRILIRAMEQRLDRLLQERQCYEVRRALYQHWRKLIQVGGQSWVFDLNRDPQELQGSPAAAAELQDLLAAKVSLAVAQQRCAGSVDWDGDLVRRMQELGYLE